MSTRKSVIVRGYVKMWPRMVFDIKEGKKNKSLSEVRKLLDEPGVYILYREDKPYYVGQAARHLFDRLW